MAYQSITKQLLNIIQKASSIIKDISIANETIKKEPTKTQETINQIRYLQNSWCVEVQIILNENELLLEVEAFLNYSGSALQYNGLNRELNGILNFMKDRKSLLVTIVFDYAQDCFLEDDIENAFLEKLGEPYKELDGGAETRDLYTDRIIYKDKRLSTVFMFKGRGQKGELTIKKSGSTGNQLLKLAKNNSAECFIVQHTNKINPDVREALQDHILQNTRMSKVYICFIDGIDTARFLKSTGKDLKSLKKK